MAKKKPVADATGQASGDDSPKRRQVNIDEDLYRKAGFIAKAEGMSLPTWVNSVLRPIIDEELPRVIAAMGLGPLKK